MLEDDPSRLFQAIAESDMMKSRVPVGLFVANYLMVHPDAGNSLLQQAPRRLRNEVAAALVSHRPAGVGTAADLAVVRGLPADVQERGLRTLVWEYGSKQSAELLLNELTESERISAFEVLGSAFSTPELENAARNPAELEAIKFGSGSN
jgi:hypothetical protein